MDELYASRGTRTSSLTGMGEHHGQQCSAGRAAEHRLSPGSPPMLQQSSGRPEGPEPGGEDFCRLVYGRGGQV